MISRADRQVIVRSEADELQRAIGTAGRLWAGHPTWGPLVVMERSPEGLTEVWR